MGPEGVPVPGIRFGNVSYFLFDGSGFMSMEGKVAVVTGASSGIGEAVAKRFAAEGADVVVVARRKHELIQVQLQMEKGEHLIFDGDVSKKADMEKLAREVNDNYGKVDCIVANAGIARIVPFDRTDESTFNELMDINVRGVFNTLRSLLPLVSEGGSIVSITTVVNIPGFSVYSATKAAVKAMLDKLALEVAHRNIRVNTIAPGLTDTPIFGKVGLPQEAIAQFAGSAKERIPMKRFGTPQEIADAAYFLASDQSRFITGCEIMVDGGLHLIQL